MSILLVTGIPGHGKSAYAVKLMLDELDRRKRLAEAGEVAHGDVYAWGFRDLAVPGVLILERLEEWELQPAGSVIFADEVQRVWGSSGNGAPPESVEHLTRHRHLGLDFVLVTQHPKFLHTMVRRLIERHVHIERKKGTDVVVRHEWDGCQEDVNGTRSREKATSTVGTLSREAFGLYKSADLHTMKARIPKRLIALAALLVVTCAAGAYALNHFINRTEHPVITSGQADKKTPARISSAEKVVPSTGDPRRTPEGTNSPTIEPEEWVKRFLPRVPGIPWSAPAYDAMPITSYPRVFCIMYEHKADAGSSSNCTCRTEQNTSVNITQATCKTLATDGLYDPHLAGQVGPGVSLASLVTPIPAEPSGIAQGGRAGPVGGGDGGQRAPSGFSSDASIQPVYHPPGK